MPSPTESLLERNVPIPLPSHPRQYRAIGLIKGQYQRSEEQITRGKLITTDGTVIDSVLLGRVISLVKKHVDLKKPHLWVVYPRTRPVNDQLHVQIVGMWEPETLTQVSTPKTSSSSTFPIQDGFFSIRGEVVYASQEKEIIIIKIRQSPKQPSQKPKFFKLKLQGILPGEPMGRFWDLQVHLHQDIFTIDTATDLGFIPKKKPVSKYNKRPFKPHFKEQFPKSDRPLLPKKSSEETKLSPPRKSLPKPIKRNSSPDHKGERQ